MVWNGLERGREWDPDLDLYRSLSPVRAVTRSMRGNRQAISWRCSVRLIVGWAAWMMDAMDVRSVSETLIRTRTQGLKDPMDDNDSLAGRAPNGHREAASWALVPRSM